MDLYDYQKAVHDSPILKKAVICGRRTGKDLLVSYDAEVDAVKRNISSVIVAEGHTSKVLVKDYIYEASLGYLKYEQRHPTCSLFTTQLSTIVVLEDSRIVSDVLDTLRLEHMNFYWLEPDMFDPDTYSKVRPYFDKAGRKRWMVGGLGSRIEDFCNEDGCEGFYIQSRNNKNWSADLEGFLRSALSKEEFLREYDVGIDKCVNIQRTT